MYFTSMYHPRPSLSSPLTPKKKEGMKQKLWYWDRFMLKYLLADLISSLPLHTIATSSPDLHCTNKRPYQQTLTAFKEVWATRWVSKSHTISKIGQDMQQATPSQTTHCTTYVTCRPYNLTPIPLLIPHPSCHRAYSWQDNWEALHHTETY